VLISRTSQHIRVCNMDSIVLVALVALVVWLRVNKTPKACKLKALQTSVLQLWPDVFNPQLRATASLAATKQYHAYLRDSRNLNLITSSNNTTLPLTQVESNRQMLQTVFEIMRDMFGNQCYWTFKKDRDYALIVCGAFSNNHNDTTYSVRVDVHNYGFRVYIEIETENPCMLRICKVQTDIVTMSNLRDAVCDGINKITELCKIVTGRCVWLI
jgi:hypothetical protein